MVTKTSPRVVIFSRIAIALILTIGTLVSQTTAENEPQLEHDQLEEIRVQDSGTGGRGRFFRNTTTSLTSKVSRTPRHSTSDFGRYTLTPNVGIHLIHTHAKTWHQARKICQAEGGDLAIINSQAESQTLAEQLARSYPHHGSAWQYYVLIGFHDLDEEGKYETIDGRSLEEAGFAEWAKQSTIPRLSLHKNCGCFQQNGKLENVECNWNYAFACELPMLDKGAERPDRDGKVGLKGEPGEKGAIGDVGDAGLRGPQGPVGPQGADGMPGSNGHKGDAGSPGLKGDKGDPGAKGESGTQGPRGNGEPGTPGPPGPPGRSGFVPPDGAPGLRGIPGLKGNTGAAGSTGSKGEKGNPGRDGDPGPSGQVGPRGEQGYPGRTGSPGPAGLNGQRGEPGDRGMYGLQGVAGEKGSKGDTGPIGSAGVKGDKGDSGLPGPAGLRGKPGPGYDTACLAVLSSLGQNGGDGLIDGFRKTSSSSRRDDTQLEKCKEFIAEAYEQVSAGGYSQSFVLRNGQKESPAKTCKDLFLAYPNTPSGEYWMDPNEGDISDAIQVRCDAERSVTCVFPKSSRTPDIIYSGYERQVWLSEIDDELQIKYAAASSQINALQLLSDHAEQNITYYCLKSVGYFDARAQSYEGALTLLAWNDFELQPTGNRLFRYNVISDGCRDRLDEWKETVIAYRTNQPARLPVLDVGFRDVGKPGQSFSVGTGQVCFG